MGGGDTQRTTIYSTFLALIASRKLRPPPGPPTRGPPKGLNLGRSGAGSSPLLIIRYNELFNNLLNID